MQFLVSGQKKLTLETLEQKGAKVTKNCQSERVFEIFSLQASSCILSYPVTVISNEMWNFLWEVKLN